MPNHIFVAAPLLTLTLALTGGHGDHHSHHDADASLTIDAVLALPQNRADAAERRVEEGRSGDGDLVFEVAVRSDRLPEEVFAKNPFTGDGRTILECAHGGFAYDHRAGRGEVYWALQGAGVLRVSADHTVVELLDGAAELAQFNLHNATFFEHGGAGRIAWPANDGARVFVTDVDGKLVTTIGRPTVEPYASGADYRPTDAAYLDGELWITDGYASKYVMSYDLDANAWTGVVFGGPADGPEPGKFGTNHGITIRDGLIWIAGRQYARIHSYRPTTEFVDMFAMPEGSKPCDFEFFVLHDELYGVAASLNVADGSEDSGASIYVVEMKTLRIVSTIKPKDELGLERFVHLHNVFATVDGNRVSLFCQAWNPGDFAVLSRVVPAADADSERAPRDAR
ncbi:MAG: hypothetical protein H6831_08125 [Planctomycetes bacterium]|nr:hypothetical protein [Planctomycetota bacterium]MCB9904358.1 hypothetical protein [Planctomycetota bacterium]